MGVNSALPGAALNTSKNRYFFKLNGQLAPSHRIVGTFHSDKLDFPVSLRDYRHSRSPEEPIVLHLGNARPAVPVCRAASSICSVDPARDILGITVNRWPHGYARGDTPPGWSAPEKPWESGRRRFGRIAFAGSDAGASALTQVAIDQALRAVGELL